MSFNTRLGLGGGEHSCSSQSSFQWIESVCFRVVSETKNFYEALVTCYDLNADLLRVPSAVVNDFVVTFLDQSNSYFIALTDDEFVYPNSKYSTYIFLCSLGY